LSKIRHRRTAAERPRRRASADRPRRAPDGSVWVRTYPVTFLHDVTQDRHRHEWHQLSFAVRGHLEVITDDARRIVPADRAVWVPAGVEHIEVMRAPVSMRSIYIAHAATQGRPSSVAGPAAAPSTAARVVAPATCRTIEVSPLLRELLLHISRIGALDRDKPEQARLVGVLFDLLAAAPDIGLELRSPKDPRARRFAELDTERPDDDASIAQLARRAGASLRTLERCFLAETGVAVGEWRRRMRLFHALRLLEAGGSVTDVALDVGYATTSAFSAAFTREFGRSPTGRRRA
jgi:AraC-like DNA-binding protein